MTRTHFVVLILVAICSIASAQTPENKPATPPTPQQESGVVTTQTPENQESAGFQVVDGILENTRTHLGFSLSVFQMYTSAVLRGSDSSDFTATMVSPQIFTNFRGRRSQLHLDYGVGYRMYRKKGDLNAFSHVASALWNVRLARYTSFQVSDSFTSSPNDYGITPGNLQTI